MVYIVGGGGKHRWVVDTGGWNIKLSRAGWRILKLGKSWVANIKLGGNMWWTQVGDGHRWVVDTGG